MGSVVLFIIVLIVILIALYIFQGYANFQSLKWVFSIFSLLLLVTTIIYYLLPEPKSKMTFLTQSEMEIAESSIENFYVAAEEGTLDSTEGVTRIEQWNFDYSGETLNIPEFEHSILLMVEKKDTDYNQIEVFQYTTKHIVGGIDFTDKIKPITATLQGDVLELLPPEEYSISTASFKKDFVVSQFNGGGISDDFHSVGLSGNQVIYLRIPKDVQLTGTPNIWLIGED